MLEGKTKKLFKGNSNIRNVLQTDPSSDAVKEGDK